MEYEDQSLVKSLMPKIIGLGGLVVLLTYLKILWPLMFGYMKNENASFMEALMEFHLHALAFSGLLVALVIGFLWARSKWGGGV